MSCTAPRTACQDADPELFFPEPAGRRISEAAAVARAICADCEVRRHCLGWAILHREPEGIWGGYTAGERRALVRDAESLRRPVGYLVRRLEAGEPFPVGPADFLAVVHHLSLRGWSTEQLSRVLCASRQTILAARQRGRDAAVCLEASEEARAPGEVA